MKKLFLCIGLLLATHFVAFADTKIETAIAVIKGEKTIANTSEISENSAPADEAEQDIPDPFNNGAEDPFQGNTEIESPTQAIPDPVLQGLAIGPERSTAVINGKSYVVGEEEQNGIELVEVRKKEADIKLGGILRTIKLVPGLKKLKGPDSGSSEVNDKTLSDPFPSVSEEVNTVISEDEALEKTQSLPHSLLVSKEESK